MSPEVEHRFGWVGRDRPRRHRRNSRIARGPLQSEQHQTHSLRTHLAVRSNGLSKGSCFMPLTLGRAVGYDADLMAFKFTMRNRQQIVQCEISRAALGDLAGGWTAGAARDLPAQFEAHRELIEAIASTEFDRTCNVRNQPSRQTFNLGRPAPAREHCLSLRGVDCSKAHPSSCPATPSGESAKRGG